MSTDLVPAASRTGVAKPRDGKGRFLRTIDSVQRDAEACRLRASGCTWQQIADQLGYSDAPSAHRAVQAVLAATVTEPAEDLRKLELEHLDELRRAAMRVLERRHVTVSHGRVIYGDDGEPLLDDGPELAAIDRLVKIAERRAKLTGLDMPVKVEGGGQTVAYVLVNVDDGALR